MSDISKRYPMKRNRKQKLTREKVFERIRELKAGIKMIKLIQQKDPAYRNKGIDKFLDVLEDSIKEMQEKLQ